MNNSIQDVFEKIMELNNSSQDELLDQQNQLENLLNNIKQEMQQLINSTQFEKDKYYISQFEKISENKKRLENVNTKMQKIQIRVDQIEKRLIKLQKEHNI